MSLPCRLFCVQQIHSPFSPLFISQATRRSMLSLLDLFLLTPLLLSSITAFALRETPAEYSSSRIHLYMRTQVQKYSQKISTPTLLFLINKGGGQRQSVNVSLPSVYLIIFSSGSLHLLLYFYQMPLSHWFAYSLSGRAGR